MLQYHFLVKVNRCSQRADPLIFRSAFKCNMRRVLVARGGALSPFSGLGGSHQRFVSLLKSGDITGYSLADILEYPVAGNSLARAYRRWSSHPKRVARAAGKGQADILHITDQEQAHLVPKNAHCPVVVTVHDLFLFDPTVMQTSWGPIDIGNRKKAFST